MTTRPTGTQKAAQAGAQGASHPTPPPPPGPDAGPVTTQDTAQDTAQAAGGPTSRPGAHTGEDAAAKDRAGRRAMRDLQRPVRHMIRLGQVLSGLSAVLAVAPYAALVHLGGLLLSAWNEGVAPDPHAVMVTVNVLIGAFCGRLTLYFLALGVTHFADARLGAHIRGRIIASLGRTPLSWFSETSSGKVRKAVQDDTHSLHTLIAHAPVESTSAVVMPLSLLVYALVIDWRLGLLSVATFPLYAGLQAWSMRDVPAKTAEMDTRLAKVSATMVEFVSGITVVKAFGKVGQAHRNYADAAREFSDFYLAWCKPLLKGSAVSMAVVAPSVLLAVNLGGAPPWWPRDGSAPWTS